MLKMTENKTKKAKQFCGHRESPSRKGSKTGKSQFHGLNAQFAKRCPWKTAQRTLKSYWTSLRRSYNRWPKDDRWVHQRQLSHLTVAASPKTPLKVYCWICFCPKFQSTSREVAVATWFRTHQTENVYDVLKCRLKLGSSTSHSPCL